MDLDSFIDRIIVDGDSLSYDERETIINEIYERTQELPIKKPFQIEQLEQFEDNDLIHYLSDVYQLIAIKFFLEDKGHDAGWKVWIIK